MEVLQTLNFPISSLHSTQPHTYMKCLLFSSALVHHHQPTHQISGGALPIFDKLPNFQPMFFLNMYSD
jgi:hypothetical protein